MQPLTHGPPAPPGAHQRHDSPQPTPCLRRFPDQQGIPRGADCASLHLSHAVGGAKKPSGIPCRRPPQLPPLTEGPLNLPRGPVRHAPLTQETLRSSGLLGGRGGNPDLARTGEVPETLEGPSEAAAQSKRVTLARGPEALWGLHGGGQGRPLSPCRRSVPETPGDPERAACPSWGPGTCAHLARGHLLRSEILSCSRSFSSASARTRSM